MAIKKETKDYLAKKMKELRGKVLKAKKFEKKKDLKKKRTSIRLKSKLKSVFFMKFRSLKNF